MAAAWNRGVHQETSGDTCTRQTPVAEWLRRRWRYAARNDMIRRSFAKIASEMTFGSRSRDKIGGYFSELRSFRRIGPRWGADQKAIYRFDRFTLDLVRGMLLAEDGSGIVAPLEVVCHAPPFRRERWAVGGSRRTDASRLARRLHQRRQYRPVHHGDLTRPRWRRSTFVAHDTAPWLPARGTGLHRVVPGSPHGTRGCDDVRSGCAGRGDSI